MDQKFKLELERKLFQWENQNWGQGALGCDCLELPHCHAAAAGECLEIACGVGGRSQAVLNWGGERRDVFNTLALHPSQLKATGGSKPRDSKGSRGSKPFPAFLVSCRMSTEFTVLVTHPRVLSWLGWGANKNDWTVNSSKNTLNYKLSHFSNGRFVVIQAQPERLPIVAPTSLRKATPVFQRYLAGLLRDWWW